MIGGPQLAYPPAVVNAIKAYVENGGRALFMLDETLRIGRSEPAAENPDLMKVLEDWGVTVNKDLVLDLSGVGQILGLGPEVPMSCSTNRTPSCSRSRAFRRRFPSPARSM